MNQREKILHRREFILNAVKNGGTTVKELAEQLGVTRVTITRCIKDIGNIHWQDDKLYYGERL